jgi:hypothetical protein
MQNANSTFYCDRQRHLHIMEYNYAYFIIFLYVRILCVFFLTAVTVGFQSLGLGVVRNFLSGLKTGTEPWNPGTWCCVAKLVNR